MLSMVLMTAGSVETVRNPDSSMQAVLIPSLD